LAPNKFQERPSGASRVQENLLAIGAPPQTPLGELTALPQTLWLVGRRLAAPSQEPHPALGLLGLRLRPIGLHPLPKIGGLASPNTMGWIHLWVFLPSLHKSTIRPSF